MSLSAVPLPLVEGWPPVLAVSPTMGASIPVDPNMVDATMGEPVRLDPSTRLYAGVSPRLIGLFEHDATSPVCLFRFPVDTPDDWTEKACQGCLLLAVGDLQHILLSDPTTPLRLLLIPAARGRTTRESD